MKKKLIDYIVCGVLLGLLIFLFIVAITLLCDADAEASYKMTYEEIPANEWARHYESQVSICVAEVEEVPESGPYSFIKLDDELQIYMEERCADLGLDFFLMASLMFSESSFKVDAVGDNGRSVGLFQINKVNWETMSTKYGLDVNVPKDNIDAGLIIFKNLMDKFNDESMAIQCYKCGESRGKSLAKQGRMLSSIDGILDRAEEYRNKAKE